MTCFPTKDINISQKITLPGYFINIVTEVHNIYLFIYFLYFGPMAQNYLNIDKNIIINLKILQ